MWTSAHRVGFTRWWNPASLCWPLHCIILSLVAFVVPVHTSHHSRCRCFLRNQDKNNDLLNVRFFLFYNFLFFWWMVRHKIISWCWTLCWRVKLTGLVRRPLFRGSKTADTTSEYSSVPFCVLKYWWLRRLSIPCSVKKAAAAEPGVSTPQR